MQYSTNRDSTWKDYIEEFEVTENNTEIYVRLMSDNGKTGKNYATGNIENIDRLEPSIVSVTNDTPTSNSVIIRATAEDAEATDEDGCSGIVKYYYSINGLDKTETTEGTSETYHEFTGLSQGKTYTIQVTAEDEAGNTKQSEEKRVTIGEVTGLKESDIGISYNPSKWTNKPVKVTLIKNIVTNYKLQYSTNRDSTWKDYTEAFDVEETIQKYM